MLKKQDYQVCEVSQTSNKSEDGDKTKKHILIQQNTQQNYQNQLKQSYVYTKFKGKIYSINLESPRTIQVAKILSFEPNHFKNLQDKIKELKENKSQDPKVKLMQIEHFTERLVKSIQEVQNEKQDILKRISQKQNFKQTYQTQKLDGLVGSQNNLSLGDDQFSTQEVSLFTKTDHFASRQNLFENQKNLTQSALKISQYMQRNHSTHQTQGVQEILGTEESANEFLEKQIKTYNNLKQNRQRRAVSEIVDSKIKLFKQEQDLQKERIWLIKQLKEYKQNQELKKKSEKEKLKIRENNLLEQKFAEQKKKEQEEKYREQSQEQRIQKREEFENYLKSRQEIKDIFKQRQQINYSRYQQINQEILQKRDEFAQILEQKIRNGDLLKSKVIQEYQSKVKEHLNTLPEHQEKAEQYVNNFKQRSLNVIVKKQSCSLDSLKANKIYEIKEELKDLKKSLKLSEIQQKIKQQNEEEFKERISKIQEKIELKDKYLKKLKNEEQLEQEIFQEENKLIEQEKKYKLQRLNSTRNTFCNELNKKEVAKRERNEWNRQQRDLLRRTHCQFKHEQNHEIERINSAVDSVLDNHFNHTQYLHRFIKKEKLNNQRNDRKLKNIVDLNPEDERIDFEADNLFRNSKSAKLIASRTNLSQNETFRKTFNNLDR